MVDDKVSFECVVDNFKQEGEGPFRNEFIIIWWEQEKLINFIEISWKFLF